MEDRVCEGFFNEIGMENGEIVYIRIRKWKVEGKLWM